MEWLMEGLIGRLRGNSALVAYVGTDTESTARIYNIEAPPLDVLGDEKYVVIHYIGGPGPEWCFGNTSTNEWTVQLTFVGETPRAVCELHELTRLALEPSNLTAFTAYAEGTAPEPTHYLMRIMRDSQLRGPEKADKRLFTGSVDYRIKAQRTA